jgi:hypothetical protein
MAKQSQLVDQGTVEALQKRIAELEAAQRNGRSLSLKVSEKGAVSCYGLGRFPVTLYGQQWLRLLDFASTVKAFIESNRDKLNWKESK